MGLLRRGSRWREEVVPFATEPADDPLHGMRRPSQMMTRLLRTVAIVCAAVSVVAAAGGRALAQDAAPALVDVVNDSSNPIPTTVTNNVPVTVTSGQVTTIPSADLNYVSFAGICGPSGGDAWVATLQGAVPLGLRLVI